MSSQLPIPISEQKRLIRLVSARTDMTYALDAFHRYTQAEEHPARSHFFLAMVLAYCRPFTENYGFGPLSCEYRSFPDFPDEEMNLRHHRMIDLRNKMLGHSSIEGTKVWLVAPGAIVPETGEVATGYHCSVAKLIFADEPRFVSWLHEVPAALAPRLDADIGSLMRELGSKYLNPKDAYILDTGSKAFQWNKEAGRG
jgi:hypothetical protein